MAVQALYSKAANAELAKDFDRAFGQYVKAAEHFLFLSRKTTEDRLRTSYRSQAAKALERAEKIRAVKQAIRPVSKDPFSDSEQLYVLQKSSLVNQGFFPLWDSPEKPSPPSQQPTLSDEQRRYGAVWRKPRADQYHVHSGATSTLLPQDIVQCIVSDCSVCAAISVCVDHHRRFGSKIMVESLYPQDDTGRPCRSESGEYQLRVLYNGSYRRVSLDDQLPTHPAGTLLCMSTRGAAELWPSLIEKAYMKLAGGYDFTGSALTGWIPEHIDVRSSDFQPEKTWTRLSEGYKSGHCVLTLGTGGSIPDNALPVNLIPVHCYAVIGITEEDHIRRLTIYDPWISWHEICNLFDGIYLSWSPDLFRHQLTFHGYVGERSRITHMPIASHFRAQLRLETTSNARSDHVVWLQLTRHVRSHRSGFEYISLSAQKGSGVGESHSADTISTKGQYTNIPHVLARTSLSADDLLTIVASYEGERDDVGFTLTAYSTVKTSWVRNPAKAVYTKDLEGAFTQKSAGGNHTHPTYYLNPQYHLRIHPHVGGSQRGARDAKVQISIIAKAERHIPINVTLAWSRGERIDELGHNDLALSSGSYSYGYAIATGSVPPGDYTLVVSAFEPRHTGKFELRMESSERFDITPIPQEGAGMFSKVIRGQWKGAGAAGGPVFKNYTANPAYELQLSTRAELQFRLQLARPSLPVPLNLTMIQFLDAHPQGAIRATSGLYSDAISGAVIPRTSFQPGKYFLVPSTREPGVEAEFVLTVYSTVSNVTVVSGALPK
ncbi:cysteine proteinase [Trametes coccinea BRFM310]|uniref:Cysteine proteinase n=1 Tax=Trametes coccinea (strain BRFM310) TaxID=1353009 RepID=A0A1Y2I7S1_TRAC3|nr:cysteine proteinase [Trametes coccinea BRFM310]